MKYICLIIEKIGEKQFRKIDQIKFKPKKNEIITYKERKQTIPLFDDLYCYSDKKTTYIFWDITNDVILKLNQKSLGFSSKMLDKILTTSRIGIVGQLVNAVRIGVEEKPSNWKQYLNPILIFIVGAVIGYLIK